MNPKVSKFLKNFFWIVFIICLLFVLRKQMTGQVVVQPRQLFVPGVSIRVGPARVVVPNKRGRPIDSAFIGINGFGYVTWNETTWLIPANSQSPSGEPIRPVLTKGGSGRGFDDGGAWMVSVEQGGLSSCADSGGGDDPSLGKKNRICEMNQEVVGFYHAETPNGMGGVNRSIVEVISHDGGYSFGQDHGVQIIGDNSICFAGSCGEADGTVIVKDGYFWLYAQKSDGKNSTVVARAQINSLGMSGSWYKYNDGGFNSPGIGGPAINLTDQNGKSGLGGYSSLWEDTNSVMLITNPQEKGRTYVSFSADGIHFESLREPLYQIGWAGYGTDWMFYPSARSAADGGSKWSGSFNWYEDNWVQGYNYTCTVKSCDWPEGAFISVRPVTVAQSANPVIGPQVGVELSLYFNETTGDYAATDAPQTPGYARVSGDGGLGYLMTAPPPAPQAAKRLWECQLGNGRHWIVSVGSDDPLHYDGDPNQTSYSPTGVSHVCENLTGDGNALTLQSLGWIYAERQENSRPLYSCLDSGTPSVGVSFFSNDSSCEGHLGFQPTLLGYIMDK